MNDVKNLHATIYVGQASSDDCYATAEIITAYENYSVDIDQQIQIYSSYQTDIDQQVQIYDTDETDIDQQIQVYDADETDIDQQIQIYDADETDIDQQIQIFENYSVDIDQQVQIYDADQTDIDQQSQIYDADEIDIDQQVRLLGLSRLYAVQTIPASQSSYDELFSEADVITQTDIDQQVVVAIPLSTDIDQQAQIYDTDETDIDQQAQIYDTDETDIDQQVVVAIPLSTDIDQQAQIYDDYQTDIDQQAQIYDDYQADIDQQIVVTLVYQIDIDQQVHLINAGLYATGEIGLPGWYAAMPAESDVVNQFDIDQQVNIFENYSVDIDQQVVVAIPLSTDIDQQAQIYDDYQSDIDQQAQIYDDYQTDIDQQVMVTRPVPNVASFLIYDPDGTVVHDYTDRVEAIGYIRRYLDKTFGICQVSNVSAISRNDDKIHSYLYPAGDFYPNKQFIWIWARITCGWGVDLDQDVQPQFQGLIETLEITEERKCNFVIIDVLKELLGGKLAAATTFDAALVGSTNLQSLNPIHIIQYLIDDVLGIQVYDFTTDTFVSACNPTSFAQAYSDCSTVVVNDTTWPANSSIIEMIQDALKLVQGWLYTGGNGRIKAKVFTNPAPTGSEKHFIGSETESNRKIMNLRLHPSRRDVINWVKWTYGQANNEYGPDYDPTSIAQYGYRPLELTTGWEVDTNILDDVSNEITSRYSQPPDVITFATSNLYGSGDGLNAELGEVIKVTDDGIGIDGLYFRIIEKGDDLLGRKSEIVAEEYVGT